MKILFLVSACFGASATIAQVGAGAWDNLNSLSNFITVILLAVIGWLIKMGIDNGLEQLRMLNSRVTELEKDYSHLIGQLGHPPRPRRGEL